MIKLFFPLFCFALSSSLLGQIGSFQIVEDSTVKVNFHSINDTIAYLHIEEFQNDQYLLGKYIYFQDSLFFKEIDDDLLIKSDVYYSNDKNLAADEIKIQSRFIHLFVSGESTFDNLTYKIGDSLYNTSGNSNTHDIIIKRQLDEIKEILVYNDKHLISSIEVHLNEYFNTYSFKIVELFTFYTYPYNYLENLLTDIIINIQGRKVPFIFIFN